MDMTIAIQLRPPSLQRGSEAAPTDPNNDRVRCSHDGALACGRYVAMKRRRCDGWKSTAGMYTAGLTRCPRERRGMRMHSRCTTTAGGGGVDACGGSVDVCSVEELVTTQELPTFALACREGAPCPPT